MSRSRLTLSLAAAVVAIAALLWLPSRTPASGCTVSWDGGASGSWDTAANWSDDAVPDANDHVCISGSVTVNLTASTVVDHYSIDSPATLNVNGAILHAEADSSNAGTINLNGNGAELRLGNNNAANAETLTNTGAINAIGTGTQIYRGDLANQGTITASSAEGFRVALAFGGIDQDRASKLTNAGAITVQAGSLVTIAERSTLVQSPGGTLNGPGPINIGDGATLQVSGGSMSANADVNLTGGSSGPGRLAFVSAAGATGVVDATQGGCCEEHPLSGNVPAGYTINLQPAAKLRAQADWSNAGTINLIGNDTDLRTGNNNAANAETLTNTGAINATGTGTQIYRGDLINQGTITISSARLHIGEGHGGIDAGRLPKLVNAGGGTITMPVTSQLSLAAGAPPIELKGGVISGGTISASLVNSGGELRPAGAGAAGLLTLTGIYTQGAGGTLSVDVIDSSHDRLQVDGTAGLDGLLEIDTSGTPPPLGTRLPILTAGARNGTFSRVAGLLGGSWDVDYQSNRVDLVRVSTVDVPALSIGDASRLEGNAGVASMAFPVTISPPPDAGTAVTVDYETSDATATAGSDYTATAGTLTFAPGDTSEQILVPILGDAALEPNETFAVRLRDAAGVPMRDPRGIGTIIGDDVSLTTVSPDRGGSPGTTTITVTGTGFGPGSALELERGGVDLAGADPAPDATGTHLTATFNLAPAELGAWDVVATGTGGGVQSLPGAFTVEPAHRGQVEASASIPSRLRYGFVGEFVVTLRNTGNTDIAIELIRIAGDNVEMRRRNEGPFVGGSLDLDADDPADSPGPPLGILPPGEPRRLTVEFRSTDPTPHADLRLRAEVFTRDGLNSSILRSEAAGEVIFPPPAGRIEGTVRTPAGQPLPGLPVTGRSLEGSHNVVFTGADGRFVFTGLVDGEYEVSLGADPGASGDRRAVEIGPADRSIELVFAPVVAEVAGSVRRADGTRLGGARVHLFRDGQEIDAVDADGGGGFSFLVTSSGTYDLLAIEEGGDLAALNGVNITAGTSLAGLRVEAGSTVLTVNTEAGARVFVRPAAADDTLSFPAIAGGGGNAQVDGLTPGDYLVRTTLPGKAPRKDRVTVGGTAVTLNAPLSPGAGAEGTVTGDGGAPVVGAPVWAIDAASDTTAMAVTNGSGDYSLNSLTPGPVELWFAAPGYAPERVAGPIAPEGGMASVDAALERNGFEVPFEIGAGTGGTPLFGAEVSVLDPDGRVPLISGTTVADGSVALGPLTPATYQVEATAPGSGPVRRPLVVAPPSAPIAAGSDGDVSQAGVPTDKQLLNLEPYSFHKPPRDTYDVDTLEISQGDLFTNWWLELPPPERQGPDQDSQWSTSYRNVAVSQPCPEANRLLSALDQSRANLDRAFVNWQSAYLALKQLNQAVVNEFAGKSALITAKVSAFVIALGSGWMVEAGLIQGALNPALSAQLLKVNDIITGIVQTARTGDSVSTQSLAVLESAFAGLVDVTSGTPYAGAAVTAWQTAFDLYNLKKDLDRAYDNDFQATVNGYRTAEKNYRDAVLRHHILMRLLRESAGRCPDPDPDPIPDEPTKPRPDARVDGKSDSVFPLDPNDIEGPQGTGPERWIKPDSELGYRIRFENVGPGTVSENPPGPPASAPAVLVTIEHTLDPAVDLDSFALGTLGWGDVEVDVPPGLQNFQGEVPLEDGNIVQIDAGLDRATRKVTWTLATIDPETGELEDDPDGGFLPPEPVDDPGAGQGRVTYTAQLLDGVPHREQVDAQARIVFDFNPHIDTPTWTNRVDRAAPRSAVTAGTQPNAGDGGCRQELAVSWGGSDSGSGIDTYTVLVSQNGQPYEIWLSATSATRATLPTKAGSLYEFVSLGVDAVGNVEDEPSEPDAGVKTLLCDGTPPVVTGSVAGGDGWRRTDAVVSLGGADVSGGTGVKEITYSLSGAASGGATVQDDSASFVVSSEGITTVTFSGKDFAGNASPPRTLTVQIDRTAPAVNISAPAEGATLTQGQSVPAQYACSDAHSGVASCSGTVAGGAPLPTGTTGRKSFTVTAIDVAGNETTVTRSYTVVSGVDFGKKLKIKVTLGKMSKAGTAPVKVKNGYAFNVTGRLRLLGAKVRGKRPPVTPWKKLALRAGKAKTFAMKITGRQRRALSAGKAVPVRAVVEVRNGAGQKRTLGRNLTLKVKNQGQRRLATPLLKIF